ncbi:MAG TPA: right-handed parallel beta-helix repeat-containing protein [Pyrinomonadaceae bacterium]|nr:right-handed parallel beta-helix repeat-containing protein [Pyrinomonadaceae bacterium]
MRHDQRSTRLALAGVVALCVLLAAAFAIRSARTRGGDGNRASGGQAAGVDVDESAAPPPSHPRPTRGAQFYAAPDGRADGDGSKNRPWDLAGALAGASKVKPGDTLWLRGGVYRGGFKCGLAGTEAQPILVAQFTNERATIDGSLTVDGEWTIFWGFEVTNTKPDRGSERPTGVEINGAHTKFINLVVHDGGNGFGFWSSAVDSELYGNIIYDNGWRELDRGHGHGIYTQNEEGTKLIRDNIIFNQYGWGVHAYTEEGALNGLRFEGNVSFDNGAPAGARYDNILVGGRRPAERITLVSNYTYETPTGGDTKPNVRLHYEATNNRDLTVKDNYFAGGSPVASVADWLTVTMTGNTFYGSKQLLELDMPEGVAASAYAWDNNSYYGASRAAALGFRGRRLDFAAWQNATGFDPGGSWNVIDAGQSAGVRVFVRPNLYEPGRAHVVVYNWDRREDVEADVSGVLQRGAKYEVRSAQNFFGEPVLAGIYDGKPLRLPTAARVIVRPVGANFNPPPTAPEFNVFVLLKAS